MKDASLLKLHFIRRGATPRAQLQADWEQLADTCNATSPSTKRWFWLQNVRALVAYRLPFVQPSEGAAAYASLFDRAAHTPQANAEDVMRLAVKEYVFTLNNRIYALRQQNAPETKVATIKAWQAYVTSLGYKDEGAAKARRVDWVSVFEENGVPEGLNAVLDQQLKTTKTPSYDLLNVSAYNLGNTNPKRSIVLQLQAKTLLPHLVDGSIDENEASRYYARLATYYSRADQDEAALQVMRERVTQTGSGYAELYNLLGSTLNSQADIDREQQKLLADLRDSSARENEVLAVSEVLQTDALGDGSDKTLGLVRNQVAAERMVTLLQSYLKDRPSRTPAIELAARLRLAQVLLALKHLDQARVVINGSRSIPASTRSSGEMKAKLEKLDRQITDK